MAFYDCLKFINEAVFSVLVIGISVFLASRQIITVGTVLTAYLCFTQLTGPLRELHRILDEFSECVVLADDYFRLLDLPVDFSYREGEAQADHAAGDEDIFLRHVNFAYPEKTDREVLTDINLYIPSGTFLGIAGPSGCGKSTLIRVLDKLEQAGGGDLYRRKTAVFFFQRSAGRYDCAGTPDSLSDCGYSGTQYLLWHETSGFPGGSKGSCQESQYGG